LSHQIHSQIPTHQEYGGVVPELASRDHLKKTLPLIKELLAKQSIKKPDAIAYTKGPGLVGALMVGSSIAHALSYAWDIPVVGVHHMEAHIMAVMLEEEQPTYPFIALIVSGGHTLLLKVNGLGDYELLGDTLDDAVGEAFDKTASLLGLPYPGGPALSKLAEQGDPARFHFPRPMVNRPGFDFSFSGLKTFALNCVNHELSSNEDEQVKADIARAFEEAVVDTLFIKCRRALDATGIDELVVAGGVSANQRLRQRLQSSLAAKVYFPRHEFCTDNAAMVAYTGFCRLQNGKTEGLEIHAKPRWPISRISN